MFAEPSPTPFNSDAEEARIAAEEAKLQAERKHIQGLAAELNRLDKDFFKVKEKLALADRRAAELREERNSCAVRTKQIWGDPAIQFRVHQAYSLLLDLDAALADFPEVRKALAKEVAEAEAKLVAFKKANDLLD